jgi:hypothetical protein
MEIDDKEGEIVTKILQLGRIGYCNWGGLVQTTKARLHGIGHGHKPRDMNQEGASLKNGKG